MYSTSKNPKILVNGTGVDCIDATISLNSYTDPLFLTQEKGSKFYNATNGIGGQLSLSYYFTGTDPLKVFTYYERDKISGNFGGLYFTSGYLSNYSLSCSPNSPVVANADILFFDALSGLFTNTYIRSTGTKVLNYCDASLIDTSNDGVGGSLGKISGISNIQFSFQSEINPLYLAGDQMPASINFGKKELMAAFTVDCYSGDLPITGKPAGIKVNFNHPELPSLSESFGVSGVLFRRELETSVGDLVRAKLYIKQAYAEAIPGITTVSNLSAAPGSSITIDGTNFNMTLSVYIGHSAASFSITSNTQLAVTVPDDVVSGDVIVTTHGGTVRKGLFTPTYSPITINKLQTISGNISGTAYISGSNFYQVTDVRFSTTAPGLFTGSSGFNVINSTMIAAPIPIDAAWGPILVMATGRGVSGQSVEKFVPIPTIYGFFPVSGMSGDAIIISGQGFSGVTGVLFNNLPNIAPFTAVVTSGFNTGIRVIVPTGNVRGPIKILVQSGISTTTINDFSPFASITGIIPLSGRTGTAIHLLGHNLFPDIMYSLGNDSFAVTFQNNVTGVFFRTQFVNPRFTGLSGLIPYNAKSGIIGINYDGASTYPSNVMFKLINEPPILSGINPKSGTYSGYISITGTNLFDISAVKLSGLGRIVTISNPAPISNALGDTVSFRVPVLTPKLTGDIYTVIVETTIGANATGNDMFTILDAPIFSGFTGVLLGTSGAFGDRILVSGKNIYPGSQIFIPYTGLSGESGQAFVDSGSFLANNSQVVFYVPKSARTGLSNIILYNGIDYASGANFKLINRPGLSGIFPLSGEWGTGVSISGSFLSNVTGIQMGTGLPATFTIITDTGINFVVPEDSASDYITIYGRGGSSTTTGKFANLMPLVSFTSITPNRAYSGEQITFAGTRLQTVDNVIFTGVTGGQVSFDYRYFTKVGTTTINMNVPANIGSGQITLRNQRGLVTSSQFFEPGELPVISNINPIYASHNETISISGSNLSGITAVYFQSPVSGRFVLGLNRNNVGLTGISVDIPREISIGNIMISGSGRLWASSNQTFIPLPTISGFSPTTIQSGNNVTITGINATSVLTGILFISGDHKFWNCFSGVSLVNTFNATGNHIVDPTTGYSTYVIPLDSEKIASGRLFLINSYFSGTISGTDSFLTSAISGKVSNILSTQTLTISETSPVI